MMMTFNLIIGLLFIFIMRISFLNPNNSIVHFFHDSLWELRLNIPADNAQKLICFSMFWKLIQQLECELIDELVKHVLIQSNKKWEVNIGEINVKLRLLALIFLKWDWHRVKIFQNYLNRILNDRFGLRVIKCLLIHVDETSQNQFQNVKILRHPKSLHNLQQYFKYLQHFWNVLFLVFEDEIIQKQQAHLRTVQRDHVQVLPQENTFQWVDDQRHEKLVIEHRQIHNDLRRHWLRLLVKQYLGNNLWP